MVFYYKDLDLPEKYNDFLIPIIMMLIILTPFFIYKKKYNVALGISCYVAVIQIIATFINILKKGRN